MLFLLHVVVQRIALDLEPFAFGLALRPTQRVGVVAVGDGEDGEVACPCDADFARVDGSGQVGEDECRGAGRNDGGGGPFDLGALTVDGDVVNGMPYFLFVVFCCGEGRHAEAGEGQCGEEGAWEHGLGF